MIVFKQKTAYEMRSSDWSSDMCSSDLEVADERDRANLRDHRRNRADVARQQDARTFGGRVRFIGVEAILRAHPSEQRLAGLLAFEPVAALWQNLPELGKAPGRQVCGIGDGRDDCPFVGKIGRAHV